MLAGRSRSGATRHEASHLGHPGLSASTPTLGRTGFGTETPEDEAFAVIDAYIDAGGNMLDTADVHGGGKSEELIGRWRAERPMDVTDRVVIVTKTRFGAGPDVNDRAVAGCGLNLNSETLLLSVALLVTAL